MPCFTHPVQPGPTVGAELAVDPAPKGARPELPSPHPHPSHPCSLVPSPPGPAPRAVSPSWASCCLAGCPEEPATEPPHRAAWRPGGGEPSTESSWAVEERPRKGCPWVLQRPGEQLRKTLLSIPPSQRISGDARGLLLRASPLLPERQPRASLGKSTARLLLSALSLQYEAP